MSKLKIICLLLIVSICEGVDETGCGTTKSCLKYPAGCSSTSADCIFFTYAYNSATDSYDMELSGGTGSSTYSSVGFAPAAMMQDVDVYFCTGTKVLSGVIQARYDHPILDSTTPKEITNVSASIESGVASCSFTRASSIQRTISGGVKQDFNLTSSSFYVLYARGAMSDRKPAYHFSQKSISASKVSFTVKSLSSECGKTVGCFQSPQGCEPGGDCQFFSWVYNQPSNQFRFTIVGKAKTPDNYQAFAFTQVNQMQDADVYYCTSKKVGSAAIAARYSFPGDVPIGGEITEQEFRVEDGAVVCSFTRAASVNKTTSAGVQTFDLSKQQYYVIYSTAVASSSGSITRHKAAADRGVSADKIDFTKFTGSGGSGGVGIATKLMRAHGILMILAWMVCANVGVVVARHYKPLWPQSTIRNKKVWFQIHRCAMVTTFTFTCLAFILIFSAVKGYSSDAGAHPIIGLVVTGLTFLNPIMAIYRPHPETPNRKFFNAAHFTVGSSARILSYATIFLGLGLQWPNLEKFTTWIMVGFVVNQVVAEIILEVVSAMYSHVSSFAKLPESAGLQGVRQKYLLLTYVVVTNIGFAATLSYYIVQ